MYMVYILVTFISYYLFFSFPSAESLPPSQAPFCICLFVTHWVSTGVASMSVGRRAIYQNGQFTRSDTNGESLSSPPLTAKSSSEGNFFFIMCVITCEEGNHGSTIALTGRSEHNFVVSLLSSHLHMALELNSGHWSCEANTSLSDSITSSSLNSYLCKINFSFSLCCLTLSE